MAWPTTPPGSDAVALSVSKNLPGISINCCGFDSYANSEAPDVEDYFYANYISAWPEKVEIDGDVIDCNEKPMECYEAQGRLEAKAMVKVDKVNFS